jgi:hypothetical protein
MTTYYCIRCDKDVCDKCVFFNLIDDHGSNDYGIECICKWCVIEKNKTMKVFKEELND